MGQVKLRQYGDMFLEVIQAYCEKHGLKENPGESAREKSDSHRRYVLVAEAYNGGETVQSLMERYHVTAGTILDHLTRYLAAGNPLREGEELASFASATPEEQKAAFSAFDELGTVFLKPVFDHLHGAVTYDDLKTLRLLYMISHPSQETF